MLFQKLATLTKRSPLVTLSIAREGAKLRVVITPKHPSKLDDDDKIESHEAALVHPLSMLGTAEELDAGIVAELDRYLAAREEVVSTLSDYEEEMKAAKASLSGRTVESKKKRGAAALPAPAPAAPVIPDNPTAKALAAV